jgi:hypothetical protein
MTSTTKSLKHRLTESELLILKINQSFSYSRLTTKILKMRKNFLQSINYKRTPHPSHTKQIIYVMFNMSKQGPQALYVGKTKHTALDRRRLHLYKANNHKYKHFPIGKFINKIKPENIGIIPLMSIQNYKTYSHYYERLWIHKLHTHLKGKTWIQPLNVSLEHKYYNKRTRTHHKHTNRITPPFQQVNAHTHPNVNTLKHLLTYQNLLQQPPPTLTDISNHKLYKLLSILINQPSHFYKKPTQFLKQHKTIQTINSLHTIIQNLYPPTYITRLAKHITDQLSLNYQNKKPRDKTQPQTKFDIIVLEHYAPYIKTLPFKQMLHEHQCLLPNSINKSLKPIIIYKNSKPTSHFLYNFNHATKNMPIQLPHPTECICKHPLLQPYVRQHQHIDTLDMNILSVLFPNNNAANALSQLMEKGTKYTETPHIQINQIMNAIQNAMQAYINKHIQKNPIIKNNEFTK